jgi:hypothetical protein
MELTLTAKDRILGRKLSNWIRDIAKEKKRSNSSKDAPKELQEMRQLL